MYKSKTKVPFMYITLNDCCDRGTTFPPTRWFLDIEDKTCKILNELYVEFFWKKIMSISSSMVVETFERPLHQPDCFSILKMKHVKY